MKDFVTRNSSSTIFFLCALSLLSFLSGCSMNGLSPVSSGGTSVTVSVSGPKLVSSNSRAVFTDSMIVYLRTIGGPASGSGPVYGPYTFSGSPLTITDIPAGSYSNIGIICFASAPKQEFLTMLSSATDAELLADDKSNTSLATFESICDGTAVAGMTGAVTLNVGSNALSAVLQPLCGSESTVASVSAITATSGTLYGDISVTPATGETVRKFYRLDLSALSGVADSGTLRIWCVAPVDDSAGYALYGADGKQLTIDTSLSQTDTDTETGISWSSWFSDAISFQDEVYLYVRTSKAVTLQVGATVTSTTTTTTTTTSAVPNIVVHGPTTFGGTAGVLTNGAVIDFGTILRYKSELITFSIENNGTAPLTVSSISLSNAAYTTTQTLPFSVPAGDSTSLVFDVTCYNSAGGETTTSTMTITSDDSDEGSFILNLTASLSASS